MHFTEYCQAILMIEVSAWNKKELFVAIDEAVENKRKE